MFTSTINLGCPKTILVVGSAPAQQRCLYSHVHEQIPNLLWVFWLGQTLRARAAERVWQTHEFRKNWDSTQRLHDHNQISTTHNTSAFTSIIRSSAINTHIGLVYLCSMSLGPSDIIPSLQVEYNTWCMSGVLLSDLHFGLPTHGASTHPMYPILSFVIRNYHG